MKYYVQNNTEKSLFVFGFDFRQFMPICNVLSNTDKSRPEYHTQILVM